MKFSIQQKDLQKLLQIAGDGVPKKSTLPILSNYLIEAKGSGVRITSTDLEISISTGLDTPVEEPGQVAVNAKRLQEIVRELPKEQVDVSLEGSNFVMKCGKSRFQLVSMSVEDFPALAQERATLSVRIPAKVFQRLVDQCCYAVSTDETRPALGGVLVQVAEKEIRFIATDGHRLAKSFAPGNFPVDKKEPREAIVPPKAMVPVAAWAVDSGEDVEVEVSPASATFKVGQTRLTSRLLQGPFPAYEAVIPKENKKALTVEREGLLSSIRRVAKLSDSVSHQIKFSIRRDRVHLSVSTADVGEAKDELAASYKEDDLDIGYNAAYLQDILKSLDTEKVQFSLSSALTAGIITAVEPKSEAQALCLIMPLRLQD